MMRKGKSGNSLIYWSLVTKFFMFLQSFMQSLSGGVKINFNPPITGLLFFQNYYLLQCLLIAVPLNSYWFEIRPIILITHCSSYVLQFFFYQNLLYSSFSYHFFFCRHRSQLQLRQLWRQEQLAVKEYLFGFINQAVIRQYQSWKRFNNFLGEDLVFENLSLINFLNAKLDLLSIFNNIKIDKIVKQLKHINKIHQNKLQKNHKFHNFLINWTKQLYIQQNTQSSKTFILHSVRLRVLSMSMNRKYVIQPLRLPSINTRTDKMHTIDTKQTNLKSLLTKHRDSLSIYEHELRLKQLGQYESSNKKKKINRFKTLNLEDQHTYDSLRKQLRSIKEAVNFRIRENSMKMENKLLDYMLFSNIKKEPQVIYQPIPMYMPPQMPMMPMNQMNPSMYSQPNLQYPPQQYGSKYPQSKGRSRYPSRNLRRNFRIAAYAALFTIRLQKFTQKVINFRKKMFAKLLTQSNQFKQEAVEMKKMLIQGLKPFLVTLLQKQDSQLKLQEQDSQNYKKQKVITTKKLFQLLINCLRKIVENQSFDRLVRSIYYFCRHGSFACQYKLLTYQQLQNISISQKHHYLQAQKSLQKSQIINFIFMKILIYNILGQSWKIDPQKFSKQKQTLQQNITILTSILYEILMDVQDDYVVNSPPCYPLNNFQQVKGVKIYPIESLTLKAGEFRKNEMISGLLNQKYVKSTYKIQKLWIKQRNQLMQIIDKIHEKIVKYHRNLIKPFL